MDNNEIAKELIKVAKELQSGIGYKIPVYGDRKKAITNAVDDYNFDEDVIDFLEKLISSNFEDIQDGKKIEHTFRLPVSIQKDRNGDLLLKIS